MSNTGHVFYNIIKIVFPSGLLFNNVNFSFLVYIVSVFSIIKLSIQFFTTGRLLVRLYFKLDLCLMCSTFFKMTAELSIALRVGEQSSILGVFFCVFYCCRCKLYNTLLLMMNYIK